MGAQGTATLDFGAFPGTGHHVTVAVTGQTGIVAGSLVEAWIRPEVSADHSADEHLLEPLKVVARDIVAGTGFTIHGYFDPLPEPDMPDRFRFLGSQPRIYGQWSVGWVWN